ncbi:MAG: hypothetical protein HZR80_18960 [Candidatus Heimdallarchaeota archaeon]
MSKSFYNDNNLQFENKNEALITLGDGVIDVFILEKGIKSGKKTNGDLTDFKQLLVNNTILSNIARLIELQNLILWGRSEKQSQVLN